LSGSITLRFHRARERLGVEELSGEGPSFKADGERVSPALVLQLLPLRFESALVLQLSSFRFELISLYFFLLLGGEGAETLACVGSVGGRRARRLPDGYLSFVVAAAILVVVVVVVLVIVALVIVVLGLRGLKVWCIKEFDLPVSTLIG
jgi:hypothetical protein